MLGFGIGEILLVALVVLLVVGPDKLPQFARSAGRVYGQVRRAADDLRRSLVLEADRQDAEARYKELQERRRRQEEARKAAEAANPGTAAQDEALPGLDDPPGPPDDGGPHAAGHDEDLQALLDDPAGPYASGRSLEDRMASWEPADPLDDFGPPAHGHPHDGGGPAATPHATPRPPPEAVAADAASDGGPPPGVSAEEWAELPPKIRAMLRGRS